jgi:hypothetical protein
MKENEKKQLRTTTYDYVQPRIWSGFRRPTNLDGKTYQKERF